MQCSYCSNNFDPFLDLSLEIAKAESLYKALGHFTAKEQLDRGAREYKCEQCKQKVKAFKQLSIHKAPEVLAVHLKRFSPFNPDHKIDRKVAFGPTLDLKPFVTGPYDGDLNYTLYGVLVHYGWSTHSGHYYCFVRTSSGMWYSLDDNQVVQVNERKVLEQEAYMLFYVRDRKNVSARNHVNALLTGRDSRMIPLANENMLNLNGKLAAEHLGLVRNTNSGSSIVPPPKASLKEHSAMERKSVDRKGDSCSSFDGSGGTTNVDHTSGNITGNNSNFTEDQNTIAKPQNSVHKKELSNFIAMPSSCKDSGKDKPSEVAEKPLSSSYFSTSSRNSCRMNGTISEMNTNMIIPIGAIEDAQVGASYIKATGPNTEDTVENEQRIGVQSKLVSDLQATTEPVAVGTEPVALGMTKKKQVLKVRRKLFKCHVSTSLSSSIIFGAGLCLRKKKHKQKRHRAMQKKSPKTVDPLDVNLGPSKDLKLGQAATEESSPLVVDNCTSSPKKKAIDVSDGQKQNLSMENSSGDCSISGNVDNDFRERVLLNGSAVSAGKQPQVRQSNAQGTLESKEYQRELRQIDIMSILTRGLDETPVARWDDDGVSLSEKLDTRAARTASQIGYIGDEWDEEYDRGKRKKVRNSKISFDGPNLFQESANRKSKAKRAKLNRSSDGNQPFRIL